MEHLVIIQTRTGEDKEGGRRAEVLISEAERGLEELEVRVWGWVSEMAGVPLQEEAGRHRQQCMERE